MGAEPIRVDGGDDYVLDLADDAPAGVEAPEEQAWRLGGRGVRAAAGAVRHPGFRTTLGLVLAVAAVAALGQAGLSDVMLGAAVLTSGLLLGVWTSTGPTASVDASPAELVAGRLLAAWVTALALLLPGLSVLLWSTRSPAALLVTVVATGVACAFGTAASVLRPRRRTAVAVAAVLLLAAGPVLLYSALRATTGRVETILIREPRAVDFGALTARTTGYDPNICSSRQVDVTNHHTERVWLLLGLSPYPALADAARAAGPPPAPVSRFDLQEARLGPQLLIDRCDRRGAMARRAAELGRAGPSWPYGLVVDVLLAAAALGAAVRPRSGRPVGPA
jgi:hypothetical protein